VPLKDLCCYLKRAVNIVASLQKQLRKKKKKKKKKKKNDTSKALMQFLVILLGALCVYGAPDVFEIRAGDHYSNHSILTVHFRSSASQSAAVTMDFMSGAYYFEPGKDYGPETGCSAMSNANKVYGSSRCGYLQPHHEDSDRFTWRRHPSCFVLQGQGNSCVVRSNATCSLVQLIAYAYDDGKKPYGPHADPSLFYQFNGVYKTQYPYHLSLTYERNATVYEIRDGGRLLETHTIPHRDCGDSYLHGYKLYPYFGGGDVAPQTVRITIDENQ
jgi:hypothetical protein